MIPGASTLAFVSCRRDRSRNRGEFRCDLKYALKN
jgi:hypothetical protein